MGENSPQLEAGIRQPEKQYEPQSGSRSHVREGLLFKLASLAAWTGSQSDLLKEFAPLILTLTGSHFVKFSLHDAAQNCMVTRYWKANQESGQFDAFAVTECVSGWVWTHQEAVTISDVDNEKRFPVCVQELRRHGVMSYHMLPLTTPAHRYGALGMGRSASEVVDSDTLEFFVRIADLAALAVENQETHDSQKHERRRLQGLVTIGQELSTTLELEKLLPIVFANLRQITSYDHAVLALLEEDKFLRAHAVDHVPGLEALLPDRFRRVSIAEGTSARAIETRRITCWSADDLDRAGTPITKLMRTFGVQSLCNVPLLSASQVFGSLNLISLRRNAFRKEDTEYLQQVANLIGSAIRNANAYQQVAQLKDRLAGEKRYLESEIRNEMRWDEIVGTSPALKRVLDYASIVATTDSTVLITGETGTGKERVARVIHSMSRRKDRSFIKLNCAAIPTGLLESELFGHEKGAFTGAVSQKIGRLELADKGTVFLDEIGEIALELQPKLLRVLQDQEFERLGGIRTIRVDARLIAATNRDLAQAVDEKQFRSDLFYRLRVFPLHLPALRDRREDIPMLVQHFVGKSSARLGRRITSIPEDAMEAMRQWSWPGNIRELENFIERSVILSDGAVLRAPLSELRQEIARERSGSEGTLQNREREHIIEILRHTRGVLSGPRGAAARLGVKRTTLQYKLQKLGISRTEYLD
jgi:formate hydrogenlyase transcriptional activator